MYQKTIKGTLLLCRKIYKGEQTIANTSDFEVFDADKIEATINQINDTLKGKDIDKKVKQKLN